MEEKKIAVRKKHQFTLRNREHLNLDGVINVESFDDKEIILETDAGMLVIRGEDLNIKELNLDSSNLSVDGFVQSLEYTGDSGQKQGKGLLSRLFK